MIIDELKRDEWDWRECDAEDGCVVLIRQMPAAADGSRAEPEEMHIPRTVLEAIADEICAADADR